MCQSCFLLWAVRFWPRRLEFFVDPFTAATSNIYQKAHRHAVSMTSASCAANRNSVVQIFNEIIVGMQLLGERAGAEDRWRGNPTQDRWGCYSSFFSLAETGNCIKKATFTFLSKRLAKFLQDQAWRRKLPCSVADTLWHIHSFKFGLNWKHLGFAPISSVSNVHPHPFTNQKTSKHISLAVKNYAHLVSLQWRMDVDGRTFENVCGWTSDEIIWCFI